MLAIQTRMCGLLAVSARTGRLLSLGGKYEVGRVDSLPPRGALRLDNKLIHVLICSVILCWGDEMTYLLEEGMVKTAYAIGAFVFV